MAHLASIFHSLLCWLGLHAWDEILGAPTGPAWPITGMRCLHCDRRATIREARDFFPRRLERVGWVLTGLSITLLLTSEPRTPTWTWRLTGLFTVAALVLMFAGHWLRRRWR